MSGPTARDPFSVFLFRHLMCRFKTRGPILTEKRMGFTGRNNFFGRGDEGRRYEVREDLYIR